MAWKIFVELLALASLVTVSNANIRPALSRACMAGLDECHATRPFCANLFCDLCGDTNLTPDLKSCCSAADWQGTSSCFAASYYTGAMTPGPTPTDNPDADPTGADAAVTNCRKVVRSVASCAKSSVDLFDFGQLPSWSSCLCQPSPTVFDGYYGSCLGYLSTAHPKYYSQVGQQDGKDVERSPCEKGIAPTGGSSDTMSMSTGPITGSASQTAASATASPSSGARLGLSQMLASMTVLLTTTFLFYLC